MSESSLTNLSGDTLVLPQDTMPNSPTATVTSSTSVNHESGQETENTRSEAAIAPLRRRETLFSKHGPLRPFRLLTQDFHGLRKRYAQDWFFNQLILASAVYLFFTNLLPGITFASDLYVLTHQNYGAIEVVFSTGLCGCIFAL